MSGPDPASIPQHVVEAAWVAYTTGPEDALTMNRTIAAALIELMDREPVPVPDAHEGYLMWARPDVVLAAVLAREEARS